MLSPGLFVVERGEGANRATASPLSWVPSQFFQDYLPLKQSGLEKLRSVSSGQGLYVFSYLDYFIKRASELITTSLFHNKAWLTAVAFLDHIVASVLPLS